MEFLDYILDTRIETPRDLESVQVVQEFQDLFPEELPRVPPERQVQLRIDLLSGAALLAKTPSWLAPDEMQELSTQPLELLNRVFIRPSSSP